MKPKPMIRAKRLDDSEKKTLTPTPSPNGKNLFDVLHQMVENLDSRSRFILCLVAMILAATTYTLTHLK